MAVADLYAAKADLKVRLGILSTDTSQDSLLDELLEGASRSVDVDCRRVFTTATTATAKTFSGAKERVLPVPDFHTVTDLVVKIDGVAVVRGADYDFVAWPEPREGGWPYTGLWATGLGVWPEGVENIEVTAKWGWASVPVLVKYAVLGRAQSAFVDLQNNPALMSEGIGNYRYQRWDPEKQRKVELRPVLSFVRRSVV